MSFLLRVNRVSYAHPGQAPLFSDVQCEVPYKARIALIGPNGSGKSTLLRLLSGELTPTVGVVERRPATEAKRVGQVPLDDSIGSGGERRFLDLMESLSPGMDLLMLDEPTNHLDWDRTQALATRLQSYDAGYIVVTHDRAFADRIAKTTWLLDHGRLRTLEGTPTQLLAVIEHERDSAWSQYDTVQRELRRLDAAEHQLKQRATKAHQAAGSRNPYQEARAKRMDRRAQAMHKRRERERDRIVLPDLPPESVKYRHRLSEEAPLHVLRAEHVDIQRGRASVTDFNYELDRGARLVLTGPNGSGKTTLLEVLAGLRTPVRGRVYHPPGLRVSFAPQLMDDAGRSDPLSYLSALGISRADASKYASGVGLTGDRLSTPVAALSGGERRRLAIASALVAESHVLFLDEPTLDLDLMARESLYRLLRDLPLALVVATHDPLLVDALDGPVIILGRQASIAPPRADDDPALQLLLASLRTAAEAAPREKQPRRRPRAH